MAYKELKKIYYSQKNEYEAKYEQRFNSEETLKFDFEINGNQAFFFYTKDVLFLLNSINKADKKLCELTLQLPILAINQFVKSCLIEETHLTNEMEGVVSTRKEMEMIVDKINGNGISGSRFDGLVKKYMMLTKDKLVLDSCADIRELYDELVLPEVMTDNKNHVPDGIFFRKDKVYVKNKRDEIIHEGVRGEDNIIKSMDKALNMLKENEAGTIISSAIFHYMFGYIHPFYDGNGRMSRYISSKLLAEELHELVSYSLSYTIKRKINEYYKLFHNTNDPKNKGDITPFVLGYLKLVLEAELYLFEQIEERNNRFEHYLELFEIDVLGNKAEQMKYHLLVNTLFGMRGFSVDELVAILEVGPRSVRTYLDEMGKDMLKITKEGHKNLYDIDLNKINKG